MELNLDNLTLGQIKEIKELFADNVKLSALPETNKLLDLGKNIIVLQRGWVVGGHLFKSGEYYKLSNGFIIRRWGTKNGLGELASSGKLPETKLEPTPEMHFHELTTVLIIKCAEDKWRV